MIPIIILSEAAHSQDAPLPDIRPVRSAFRELNKAGYQLCYEDAALASTWAPVRGAGPAGVKVDAIRTLDITDLDRSSEHAAASDVLAKSNADNPLLHFKLIDVGGCLTAVPTERLSEDSLIWEPVVSVLDRTIDIAATSTFSSALQEFSQSMRDTGLDFQLNDQSVMGISGECAPKKGESVARDALAEILACSPVKDPTFGLLTSDGVQWTLNVSHTPVPLPAFIPDE
jgi:hypothetical protein